MAGLVLGVELREPPGVSGVSGLIEAIHRDCGAGSFWLRGESAGLAGRCQVSQWIARITRVTRAPTARQVLRCGRGLRQNSSSRSWPRLMVVCCWLVVMGVASFEVELGRSGPVGLGVVGGPLTRAAAAGLERVDRGEGGAADLVVAAQDQVGHNGGLAA